MPAKALFPRIVRSLVLVSCIVGLCIGQVAYAAPARSPVRAAQSLPEDLEKIRASEATALYGSPDLIPAERRKSAIISLGDSQLSGEGAGNYEPGTTGPTNRCHRSGDAAIHQASVPVDLRFNLACSGAESSNLVYRGPKQYNELNQGDNLAIKARNTNVKMLWLTSGANDTGGIEFGPVAKDCVTRRLMLAGNCWPSYTDGWQRRVNNSQAQLEKAIASIKETMRDAGYNDSDYQLVVMSYPSPFSPDVEDNPNFPGWNQGGCLLYLKDAAFARNKVAPLFAQGVRQAARNTGVRYLDSSRLMHGHEVCTDNPWMRGLTIEGGSQQSFHPNAAGHRAYGDCISAFYQNPSWKEATCVDSASSGQATLYQGRMDFKQLRNSKTSLCVDAEGYSTRVGYRLLTWSCTGGGNQGFWRDPATAALHIKLNHDRCVTPTTPTLTAGSGTQLHECSGGANQRWALVEGLLRSTTNPHICLAPKGETSGSAVSLVTCDAANPLHSWSFEAQTGNVGYGHSDWTPTNAW